MPTESRNLKQNHLLPREVVFQKSRFESPYFSLMSSFPIFVMTLLHLTSFMKLKLSCQHLRKIELPSSRIIHTSC